MRLLARIALATSLLLAAGSAVGKEHVVTDGQTLGKIAKRYQISIAALCKANSITRHEKIKAGQHLNIPGGDDSEAPTDSAAAAGEPSADKEPQVEEHHAPESRKDGVAAGW